MPERPSRGGGREVENGPATILANVAGSEVREYSVEISRAQSGGRLMVTVTDPALLAATGGIVQGMSGSRYCKTASSAAP